VYRPINPVHDCNATAARALHLNCNINQAITIKVTEREGGVQSRAEGKALIEAGRA